jgi:WD40 repeat protein
MDNIARMGANPFVHFDLVLIAFFLLIFISNPSSPRLASSSKDFTVRVWSLLTRRTEYTLGGHTASVNVVKWGGAGTSAKGVGNSGVLYTASSDRTVRVWDADSVSSTLPMHSTL